MEIVPAALFTAGGLAAVLVTLLVVSGFAVFVLNKKDLNPEQSLERDILKYTAGWRTGSRPSDFAAFDFAVAWSHIASLRDAEMPTGSKQAALVSKLKLMSDEGLLNGRSHMGGGEYSITALGYEKLSFYQDKFGIRGAISSVLQAARSLLQTLIIPVVVSVIGTAVTLYLGLSEK